MQFRLQTISKQRDRNQKRKYIRLRALAHYETNIMTRGGFRKHIPRKRYEAWSTRALRYLNYDIHIKYAFSYEQIATPGTDSKLFKQISWSTYKVCWNFIIRSRGL